MHRTCTTPTSLYISSTIVIFMVKKISISISEQVHNQYLTGITGNRSRYIENLIIEGSNAMISDNNQTRNRLLKSQEQVKELEEQLKTLKFEIDKRKSDRDNKKADREKKIANVRGILASGVLQE